MVIKVYISGISGNKEVKKRQQRVLLILDSKNVKYEVIDIAEPGAEELKDFMQNNSTYLGGTISDPSPRHPLPPQIYNDDDYCGDYEQFDMANEIDEMEKFLKLETADATDNLISNAEIKLKNGDVTPDEKEPVEEEDNESALEATDAKENKVPNDQEKDETEEKSKDDEDIKDNEETNEADKSKSEEPEEEEESTKTKESEETETKDNNVEKEESEAGAAGDEEVEEDEELNSKKKEVKAEE